MSGPGSGASRRVTGTQKGRDTPRVSRPCGDRSGSARDARDLHLRGDLRVQPNRDGVLADRLDLARHVDGPPVERGTARGTDGVDDIARRDRAEETAGVARRLGLHREGELAEVACDLLGVVEVADLPRPLRALDRLN